MSRLTFNRGSSMFPIRYQIEIDLAAFEFRQVDPGSPIYNRARAWLAYAAMTALVDGWAYDNTAAWGSFARYRPQRLGKAAQQLAQEALSAELASPKKQFEYDVRWAMAFVYLHRGKFGKAKSDLDAALDLKDGDGNSFDAGLLAEAADFYVYLGMPGNDTTLKSYRGAIKAAFAEMSRLGRTVPEWFYWVRGWTRFADAALAHAANDPKGESLALVEARQDLELVVPNPKKLNQPHDYDACAALAAVLQKMGEPARAAEAWEALQDAIWDLRQRTWTPADELKRSPFRVKRPTAGTIQAYWKTALEAVQKSLDDEEAPED